MNIQNILGNYSSIINPVLDTQVQLFIATTIAGVASRFVKKIVLTILKTLTIILGIVFIASFLI